MTVVYLRTRADEREPVSGLLLDWFGRGGASTISGRIGDLTRGLGTPDPLAVDLLRLAVAVYGADKIVLREGEADRWTRPLRLHIAVADNARWRGAASAFASALRFLTNDDWDIRFRADQSQRAGASPPLFGPDAVCLFSGGLDSLAGAIDLLEDGHSVVLVGHYDSNHLLPRQEYLYERLRAAYGDGRVMYQPFYLRPASVSGAQARPLPTRRESTTRSRSFLFMAAAGVVASSVGLDSMQMPENGYIGLNVPLEISRVGACSTRTTHPHFLALLRVALNAANVPLQIENPYQLKTKGEVLQQCRDRDLLLDLAPRSVSCAHPEVGRWSGQTYANCGYCFPCLMRRASLHQLGADDASAYLVDVGDRTFLDGGGSRTGHLRALIDTIKRPSPRFAVLRSGPLPRGRVREFEQVYERGRGEIRAWLAAAVPASR